MRHKGLYILTILVLAALSWAAFELYHRRSVDMPALAVASQAPLQPQAVVTAPGRVEPISEEIEIGAEISGKLKMIAVEEGSHVQAGQTLAVIENSDYEAQIASAQARLSQAEAELRRVINGARGQERREAWAVVEATEAVMRNAEVEMERRQLLRSGDYISKEEADRAERDLRMARARRTEARERYAFVNAEAREEDRARAQATVAYARAQLQEARARLDKTFIRSPITGVVLRKRTHVGESVAPPPPNASLFTVADVAKLRVRIDVDESDVGKLCLGQRAYVTAVAYGNQKFWGSVVRIGQMLGKKNIRTDEPVERVDTKILETLVELDDGQILPLGLRVDSFILMSNLVSGQ